MSPTVVASLLITYAVFQTVVFLILIRMVDPYEREPMSLLALMALWGALGATTLSAIGNTAVRNLLPPDVAVVFGRALYAPVVEEVAKGIALVVFVLVSVRARGRFGIPRFEGITDGVVYGAAIGLGFAFTEDILYLLVGAAQNGLESGSIAYLARRDFFGVSMLRHAIYTATFGVGLGLAMWSRAAFARVVLPAGGLLLAMFLHSFNNGWGQVALVRRFGFDRTVSFVQGAESPVMEDVRRNALSAVRVSEYVLLVVFALAIYLWIRYQRKVIRAELEEEAQNGLISRTEWDLLPRYWRRTAWYWQLIRTGQWQRWRILQTMHGELVSLAIMKMRVRRAGAPEDAVARLAALA
ncbi:MAG TPA: PrsW family intramembrane metalloprotease, partial [Actinomycetota bacterium]|nr:PrsW family intramembrane metalloprotease [Actinomycetota bacterium]